MNWRAKTACIKTSSECSRLMASKTSISFLRPLCFRLSSRNSAVRHLSPRPVCQSIPLFMMFVYNLCKYTFFFPSASISDCFAKDKGPWIIKPVASSRGRGIYLVSNVSDVRPLCELLLSNTVVPNPFGLWLRKLKQCPPVTPRHTSCPRCRYGLWAVSPPDLEDF